MPIVASMGGNAGTQTLTVAVRALAMRELTAANALRFVGKELLVGGLNGLLVRLLTGTLVAVALVRQSEARAGVRRAPWSSTSSPPASPGVAIPLGLDRLKVDPAVASGGVHDHRHRRRRLLLLPRPC